MVSSDLFILEEMKSYLYFKENEDFLCIDKYACINIICNSKYALYRIATFAPYCFNLLRITRHYISQYFLIHGDL